MKIIIVFIFIFLIFYFIWQVIKRTIFLKFFKNLENLAQNNQASYNDREPEPKRNRELKKNINWDAETVEYEEIPNDNPKK